MPSSHSLKAYFGLAAILGGLTLCATADAQSGLPACPTLFTSGGAYFFSRKHNCWGAITYSNGTKYVGAFKDDKPDGYGTLTNTNGTTFVGTF